MAHELVDSHAWPHPPSFDDFSTAIIRNILSFSLCLSTPLGSDEESSEVRCCNCLNNKTFPFRSGETELPVDENTGFDCRVAVEPCQLDQKASLGPWCCKQSIPHPPGRRTWAPALVLTNNIMYTVWNDLPIWVFCNEYCLEAAINRLPYQGKGLFANVRFFEQNNNLNVPVLSYEYYGFDRYRKTDIIYVSKGNQLIEYKGTQVWVKDMWLSGTDRAWELEQKDKEEQRARKGKGKRKWDGEDDDGPKKQQKLDKELAEVEEDWDMEMASLSPRSQVAKKLASGLEMAFMEHMEAMDLE